MRDERLIELRERLGLTQEELGKQVGLTQSMIAHIEAGRREPRRSLANVKFKVSSQKRGYIRIYCWLTSAGNK